MVERTTTEGLDEFVGTVRSIEIEEGNFGRQYHLAIEPEDSSLTEGSKTGMFHQWLRITKTTTETSVPEGSCLDAYIRAIERLFKQAKTQQKIVDVLNLLLDKKILYVREKLGRSFEGKPAADYWVPNKLIK